MPTISIIMPAYNAAPYIAASLDSIRLQSFHDWELLVTDDGSTDRTAEIVRKYSGQDDRIILLKNECGKGPATARNNSLLHANGAYIAFLDADDRWAPGKLEKQLAFMTQQDVDFAYTGYNHINVAGEFIREITIPESVNHKSLLTANVIATATVMIRRDAFSDLSMPDFPRTEDYALWLILLRQTDRAYGLNESLSDYRLTPNTGNRRKIYALKYLYDIYTQQERISPFGAMVAIFRMYIHRTQKYGSCGTC